MEQKKKNAVAIWLIAGVVMIIVQTLLGGVTRLTGSGLSITEWKPIMGAIPPMTEAEWNHAFDGYKQIGQYKYLNSAFTLSDFKFIFFWEWFHRLWARSLGVVFAIGFVWFLYKKCFDKSMIKPFIVLFILGGLQGLIGWIMVSSGVNGTSLYVNHVKLAIHFIAAMILAVYTLWFALKLLIPETKRVANKGLATITGSLILLLFVQLTYGAFMAGLKGALVAPTWPSIDGYYVPDQLKYASWISDPINVHFFHRNLAYLLLILLAAWFFKVVKASNAVNSGLIKKAAVWPVVLVFVQVLLGIFTVLNATHIVYGKFGVFEAFAETHQLVAMFLLMSLVVNYYIVSKRV